MEAESARALLFWKCVAIAAMLAALCSVVAMLGVIAYSNKSARMTDERLIGTWQSDADRTIAGMPSRRPGDDKQDAALRTIFGKLRVTYTPTTFTSDLDGTVTTCRYEVLGRDKHSVVTREVEREKSGIEEAMKLSEFGVIYFDGPDSYWLYTQIGGIKEYFKRVP